MTHQRALQPQDQIAHYRIVGPLGQGGMGEVYLAQDQTLERNVALKILPPELVRSEDRVRRFVREAKSASSLNHPNIVTIYEIGEDEVRGGDGVAAPGSSAVHYISMELVSGETLSTKIHEQKTDLRTLLGYLAQAAEGLAKAHAAGIVHRDLKPGNIMVSKDGFAKVLDFGLAKLTEKAEAEPGATLGATEAEPVTGAGAVVGTVGYMAPEQVRGGAVDHRADIFSFGCILYEAATRKRPFVADSNVETMHKILHDKPAPVEELNHDAPAELRRLIRRCLAKNPDQRLQSAKDLAIELREIVDEYDALSASGSSGSGSSAAAQALPGSERKGLSPAVLVASAIVVAGIAIAAVLFVRHGSESSTRTAPPALKISTIASPGIMNGAALSPDGRYLAYSMILNGERTLWVRQVATGSDVQILGAQKVSPGGLVFAPSGDYLYYQSADPDRDGYQALFEIPTLGGTPKKRAYDVDSRVTFSPDGTQIAFMRGMPQKDQIALVTKELGTGKERILAAVHPPVIFGQPSWSPDGKQIAILETRGGVPLGASVVTYRVSDGRREPIGRSALPQTFDLAWMPDGRSLVLSGTDPSTQTELQLWRMDYPDGHLTRLTNDSDAYAALSVSADGRTIAAVRARQQLDLWMASPNDAHGLRQVTFGSGDEGAVRNFTPGPDSTIFYESIKDGSDQIFTVTPGGAPARSITEGQLLAMLPSFVPGLGIIYVHADADMIIHIWRMDVDGSNARAVTSGPGEFTGDISRDGRVILFYRNDSRDVLWKTGPDGGEPTRVAPSANSSARLSPDGHTVLHSWVHEVQGQGAFTSQLLDLTGAASPTLPTLPPRIIDTQWLHDGSGISYIDPGDNRLNLHVHALSGGPEKTLTHFTDGRLGQHRWSPDGKRLVITRRVGTTDNLWVVNADGSHPVAITDFESGSIVDARWSNDGSRIFFTYGVSSQNLVLIRGISSRS
ncbi:MAG TPA: protein kinase [Candidatus Eisenbacteria bacterium]|nr:protein kinase [Candidatus Eisenbacteria bacterium]